MLPASRILVMRYRFIGDTILIVPFLRNLRRSYPDAIIDVLVGPQSGSALEGCPYINQLITFDTTRFHKYDQGTSQPRHFLSYARELRKHQYDLTFILKRSFSAAFLSWLIGSRYRVGYGTQARNFLLTHLANWNQHIHEVESTLDVLRAVDIPVIDNYLEAWISEKEHQEIKQIVPELADGSTKIAIHAAAAHPDKLYPLARWSYVIQQLVSKAGARIFFTGAAQDYALYKFLSQEAGVNCVNLAGKLSLRQSMALYEQMQLVACVDSGPAHLAAACQTPVVSLFGPTDPERWRPWGNSNQIALLDESLPCRPCNYRKVCDNRPCLTGLPPDTIVDACLQILQQSTSNLKKIILQR